MRSDFEKLPIIQEIMADEYDGLMFDERFSKYLCPSDGNEEYLNGAWMVWQQRQTEVDELQKRVDELATAFNQLIEMESESISTELDQFDKGWNQSARQTIENIFKLTGLGEQALKGGGE